MVGILEITTLKPCPFCRRDDLLIEYDEIPSDLWMCTIFCTYDAPAVMVSAMGIGDTKEEAYSAAANNWNTRNEPICRAVKDSNGFKVWTICSECGHGLWEKSNYCPNCGAKVVEE